MTVILLPALSGAAVPSWFVSPPESAEKFYFLAAATSTDKSAARKASLRDTVVDSSSYLGEYFDRTLLELVKERYGKDIKSGVYTCYMLSSYPRSDTAEKELRAEWRRKEIKAIFVSAVKKSKKLAARDRVIEAIELLSAAKTNKLLPEVKKAELENMIREFVTRVKIRPLEYPHAGNTKAELCGELGVLVSVLGRVDKPVRGMNMTFGFTRNSGFIDPPFVTTDKKGLASVKVRRFNRAGEAVIFAKISNARVPEFSYIPPARFQIEVGGGRVAVMKGVMPVRRGRIKKQNIVLLEDNLPVGVLLLETDLRPDKMGISAKIVPTKDIAGFVVDKQAHVAGIKTSEISKNFSVSAAKIKEGDNFSIEVEPFEVIIIAQKLKRETIKIPLSGQKDTIRQMLLKYVLFYR